jgi:hypothetical protein
MEKWEKFFKYTEDYHFTMHFYENSHPVEMEEIYQAFKARLISEDASTPTSIPDEADAS